MVRFFLILPTSSYNVESTFPFFIFFSIVSSFLLKSKKNEREKKKNTSGKNHMKKFQKKKAELLDIWHLYSNNKNITSENIEV